MRFASTVSLITMAILCGCATTSPEAPKAPETRAVGATLSATPALSRAPTQELTQETIGEIVQSHFGELEACYEASLAADNSLAGIVELELTIAQDGTIEEGRLLKDGLGSAELNLCLVKKMVEWTFPPHTDEAVTIQFPFAFSPKR